MSKRTDSSSSLPSWGFWMISGAVGVVLLLVMTQPSYAVSAGPGNLELTLMNVVDYLTGTTAQILGSLAMVGVLYGVIMRSQRGESVSSLATIGVALILIVNLQDIIDLLPFAVGASMY